MSGLQLRSGPPNRASLPVNMQIGIDVPSVMVSLSEPADSTARWRIRLEAQTQTTRKTLGTVLTIAPASGSDSNRIIALATVPGAIGWHVQAELERGTGTVDSEAILDMAVSHCCGSLGLVPLFSSLVTELAFIPRTVIFNGVLPGAGAFTNPLFASVPIGTKRVTFWVTYTRGGVGGFPAFRAQWSNGVEEANEAVEDLSSLVVAQPIGTINVYEHEMLGPIPGNATPLVYPLVFDVPDGTSGVRLIAAERGAIATPGTVLIALTGSG